MTTEGSASAAKWWAKPALILGVVLAVAIALPALLGYVYAWAWVLPYTSVCKASLLSADFTAEEYRNYLLNHGCNIDEEIKQFVRNRYASSNNNVRDEPFTLEPQSSKPPLRSNEQVEETAARAVAIFHGKTTPQNLDEATLLDAVGAYLDRFRPFTLGASNCAPNDYCAPGSSWSDDIVSRLFAWAGGAYGSFAAGTLRKSMDAGVDQVAAVWAEGPLLRGGLLLAYILAIGLLAAAILEFVKWFARH